MQSASAIERRTMAKVYLRLLPFCFVLYFICYLDRVNIGFAALTMNKDLGLSSYIFGLGAGAFFWGYFILEVPSNLILDRVGARRWIARIMVTWGLVSGGFAFISGPVSFFTLRFLLGLAEAGFFPGIILYFTYWFPPSHRARIVAGFMAAIPISIGLGAPISTSLLELDGVLGVAGWRWLFFCEAAPAVIFGIVTFFYLTDRVLHDDGGGMPDRRAGRQHLLGGAGAVARHDRPLRVAGASVPLAGGVSDGARLGERHRLGQLGRHLGRQRQPPDRRLVQGCHRQL